MQLHDAETYTVEEIPDEDSFYYRIHKTKIDFDEPDPKKKIKLLAFDPQSKIKNEISTEMSTDWSRYSSTIDSQNRARIPNDNGIVSFLVSLVKDTPYSLSVRHDPVHEIPKNLSHSLVFDVPARKNDIGIRLKLRDICNWEIPIEE